jgi:hypothetical protein
VQECLHLADKLDKIKKKLFIRFNENHDSLQRKNGGRGICGCRFLALKMAENNSGS